MDASEFFREVVEPNWNRFARNSSGLRELWNAVVSMNTVAEYLALERMGYKPVSREELAQEANQLRAKHPILCDLKHCAETFKHVRKIKDHKVKDRSLERARFTTLASSTAAWPADPASWAIGPHDPVKVLCAAYEMLKTFPEFR